MKTRTVTLEVEIEGGFPDALQLRDEVEKIHGRRYSGHLWRVARAEVLIDGTGQRDGWRLVRTGPCRDPKAGIGQCGCRELTILEERQSACA
jgi:hypothetical protein